MKRLLVGALTALILAAPFSVLSEEAAGTGLDITSYTLKLDIPLDHEGFYIFQNTLTGMATLKIRNITQLPVQKVPLLLNRLLRVESAVRANDTPLMFEQEIRELDGWTAYQANVIEVAIDQPLAPGAELTLTIAYGGRLTGYTETGMLYVKERLDPAFTIIRSESMSYPQLAWASRASLRRFWGNDSFDQKLEIILPQGQIAANGGRSTVETLGDGRVAWRYESITPGSLIILPIAPYGIVEVGKNRVFYMPGSAEGAEIIARSMTSGLAFFSEHFGALDVDFSLALIEIPEGFGSQSIYPTIIQTSDAFNDAREMSQLFHELSHLWNVANPTADSARLEEGLATFFGAFLQDRLTGTGTYHDYMDRRIERMVSYFAKNPEHAGIPLTEYGQEDITYLSYSIGGIFFGIVFELVGEEAFLRVLGDHYQTFHNTGADIPTFMAYLDNSTEVNLAPVIEDWIFTTGFQEKLAKAESFPALVDMYR